METPCRLPKLDSANGAERTKRHWGVQLIAIAEARQWDRAGQDYTLEVKGLALITDVTGRTAGLGVVFPLRAKVGWHSNFMAMNADYMRAVRAVRRGCASENNGS
jgi:hypothetical protein